MVELPLHTFDAARAGRYEPRPTFSKTAILLETVDPQATMVIQATFGEQTLRGSFYLVAEGDGSYGASRQEFEKTHRNVGPNHWVKTGTILAYRADETCRVESHVGDTHETSVVAEPGHWIVKQATGEVMVVKPDEFESRYQPTDEPRSSP